MLRSNKADIEDSEVQYTEKRLDGGGVPEPMKPKAKSLVLSRPEILNDTELEALLLHTLFHRI